MKYSLKRDHAEIKKQIKEWEIAIDFVVNNLLNTIDKVGNIQVGEDGEQEPIFLRDLSEELDELSQEMMAINI